MQNDGFVQTRACIQLAMKKTQMDGRNIIGGVFVMRGGKRISLYPKVAGIGGLRRSWASPFMS
jgi:hypothetical protein